MFDNDSKTNFEQAVMIQDIVSKVKSQNKDEYEIKVINRRHKRDNEAKSNTDFAK